MSMSSTRYQKLKERFFPPDPGHGQFLLWFRQALFLLLILTSIVARTQETPDTLNANQKTESGLRENRLKPTDSSAYLSRQQQIHRSENFYHRLKKRSDTSNFLKNLYPLIFRKPPSAPSEAIVDLPASLPYAAEKGKIIRSIKIRKLPVFGSSVYDSIPAGETRFQRFMNRTHIYSRDAMIHRYLMIEEGKALNPVTLADNERTIRNASIFEDARFQVTGDKESDSVDVILLIKDVFPFGFDLKVDNAEKGRLRVYNRNFLGLGHQPEQWIDFNLNGSPAIRFSQGAYKVRNIRSSFTDAAVYWQDNDSRKGFGLDISRPFITPEIRYGGGLKMEKFSFVYPLDVSANFSAPAYKLTDLWSGYATIIERPPGERSERLQAAFTARYYDLDYTGLPDVSDTIVAGLYAVRRFTGEISLIRSGFYLNNMIYGFGRTEDIPTGYHAGLILGHEQSILASAPYTAIKFTSGLKINGAGYIFSSFYLGGYWETGHFRNGLASISFSLISGLKKAGTYRFRHFLVTDIYTGISRTNPLTLSLNRKDITETFRKYDLKGLHRATARYEIVAFTPYYLLGFRFAGYAFGELGMISQDLKHILKQAVYPAFGAGIRIRNENLVFSTFQLSFSWYPRASGDLPGLIFELEEPDKTGFGRFGISPPEFLEYR